MHFTTLLRHPILLALALAAASPKLTAQDVHLSEVCADGGQSWVEVHNSGSVAVDVSTWSLYASTKTPGMPQSYWWPFPAGTVLPAGGYLRVHWFRQSPGTTAPGEFYTGVSPYGFLFGLGGEPLAGTDGALALFRTQANAMMNSAAQMADWVSWGDHGFVREPLAIAAGLWSANRAAPAIDPASSLARDPAAIGATTHPDESWFVDGTPTPLAPNVSGAVLQSYGAACTLSGHHLLGSPVLEATSLPLLGNGQFALTVENTTGIYGEFVLLGFSAGAAAPGTPSPLPSFVTGSCATAIDPFLLIDLWLVPAQLIATTLPLPLAGLPPAVVGAELHAQALVLDLLPNAYLPYQGVSNALRIVVGE